MENVIEQIKNFKPETFEQVENFVMSVIIPNWQYSCYEIKRPYNNTRTVILHTVGWSENEEIISAIENNIFLGIFFHLIRWETGGHYTFRYKIK